MANEKMTEYYTFGRETELYKLLSELDEEAREDYIDGFDELSDDVERKVDLIIEQFIDLVYGYRKGIAAQVTEITDENVELCIIKL